MERPSASFARRKLSITSLRLLSLPRTRDSHEAVKVRDISSPLRGAGPPEVCQRPAEGKPLGREVFDSIVPRNNSCLWGPGSLARALVHRDASGRSEQGRSPRRALVAGPTRRVLAHIAADLGARHHIVNRHAARKPPRAYRIPTGPQCMRTWRTRVPVGFLPLSRLARLPIMSRSRCDGGQSVGSRDLGSSLIANPSTGTTKQFSNDCFLLNRPARAPHAVLGGWQARGGKDAGHVHNLISKKRSTRL